MKPNEFENYLSLLCSFLRVGATQRNALGDELRDHLESRIAELVESGCDESEAERRALAEFGDAASLAQQFQSVFQTYRRRWMMRFTTFAIAGSFLILLLAFSMWPENSRFGAPARGLAQDNQAETEKPSGLRDQPSDTAQRNEKINKILTQPASMAYDEIPFEEVLNNLREKYQINIVLDQSAMDDLLPADASIKFQISEIPLGAALRLMLREKNGTYLVQDGVLRIISLDVASDTEYFERHIVDVSRLLETISHAELHSDEWSDSAESSLMNLVRQTVSPQSWQETNGDGALQVIGGLLVIYQSRHVIDETTTLLEDLEFKFAESNWANRKPPIGRNIQGGGAFGMMSGGGAGSGGRSGGDATGAGAGGGEGGALRPPTNPFYRQPSGPANTSGDSSKKSTDPFNAPGGSGSGGPFSSTRDPAFSSNNAKETRLK